MDLIKMDGKADRQVYKSIMQFQVDAMTIVHNVSIFHGGLLLTPNNFHKKQSISSSIHFSFFKYMQPTVL